ncbi:dipeptidase PepV [Thalassobacillus hwangdonensis]|uniref:Dipeptidase PepV n=1 Tax=Thalassobacillus hwangdonensis TaxID=546108 RepID=A0ABW3L0Q6_9BACI
MEFKALAKTYEKEFLEKVDRILRIPSVYEESNHYPFGKSIDDVLHEMLHIGEEDGFTVKNIDGYAGHIEWGTGEDLIGILGHLDVVPAGDGWTSHPFEPEIRDGNLYARGAQDDKGPTIAAYIAMKLLKDQGFEPKKRIRLIVGTDEERDWQGIKHYFKKEEMPGFGFSPDAAFPVIHAEKGLVDGYAYFDAQDEESDTMKLEAFTGGDRLNMVPDYAEAVLEVEAPVQVINDYQVFLDSNQWTGNATADGNRITLQMEGKAAHASKPAQGANAIDRLARFLKNLPFSQKKSDVLALIADNLSDLSGKAIGIQSSDDVSGELTLNIGSLRWKEQKVEIGFNMRYPVSTDGDKLIQQFSDVIKSYDGSYELYDHLKSLHVEETHPDVQTLLSIYNKQSGDPSRAISIGGATYARALTTGVAYGAMFAHSADTAHQRDEHVKIKDMLLAISIYAEAIYELTK